MTLRPAVMALAFALLPLPAAAQDDAARNGATEVVATWADGFNAGDVEKILATYSSDATVFGTTSPDLAAGGEALKAYFTRAAKSGTKVKINAPGTATPIAPDGVVVAGLYEFSGTRADGTAFTAPARYTFVVARKDGAWRIVHQHSSPLPKPPQ